MEGMKLPVLRRYATRPGVFLTDDGGLDAVLWSDTATRVWFCVIENVGEPSAFADLTLEYGDVDEDELFDSARRNPVVSRTINGFHETLFAMSGPDYGKWFVHIPSMWDGLRYGYRTDGPWDPVHGMQFNPRKFLIDPCAKGLDGPVKYGPAIFSYKAQTTSSGAVTGNLFSGPSEIDSIGSVPCSVVIDDRDEHKHDADAAHPHIPWARTILYELHVKGFTKNAPWLSREMRGTYAGLAHPQTIAYLKGLGVTSIELLPIFAKMTEPPLRGRGQTNYWGYSTLGYFSPEPSYATKRHQMQGARAVRQEVIDMVEALHQAGLEVILDVVYNHSCEGGGDGYTLCWRGIDSYDYYRRDPDHPNRLIDTTGTGNTFNFLNTNVITAATDSLRYWARRIGVDGFRFDLAVSLGRLEYDFTPHHPFLYAIRSDTTLGNLKMIMEPWDTGGGGWRTGRFGMPFSEWNDHFRDTVRAYWLTDEMNLSNGRPTEVGMQAMATRLCGSADLFATEPGRGAAASVNFITAHDGFTLADLTRYNSKHNLANGENNADGSNSNHSTNFGVKGPSDDPAIGHLRQRAALGLIGTLLLSMGTPMLQAGDEFGRTQRGNNNAYCQDNEISWVDWDWINSDNHSWRKQRFGAIRKLIHLRQHYEQFHHHVFYTRTSQFGQESAVTSTSAITWYLPDGRTPTDADWYNTQQRSFIERVQSPDMSDVLIIFNGSLNPISFHLPTGSAWELHWTSQNIHLTLPGERELTVPLADISNDALRALGSEEEDEDSEYEREEATAAMRSLFTQTDPSGREDMDGSAAATGTRTGTPGSPLSDRQQEGRSDASNTPANATGAAASSPMAADGSSGQQTYEQSAGSLESLRDSGASAHGGFSNNAVPGSTENFIVSTAIRGQDLDEDEHNLSVANPGEQVTIPGFTVSLWIQRTFEG